ncbi:hypothetical protein Leryth_001838 [Lithospermum erythrorhizon]|nr:hypothetical protein Leryth_001838 [Lithospermum erythrorhizon]
MAVALAVGGACFLSAFLQVAFCVGSHRVAKLPEAKKAKSPLVGKWLDKLKAAMHHADDLLDELNTECLRLKLHYDFQPSDAELAFNSHFIQELMPNLKKITARLEYFVERSHHH